jgi:nitronate monooxygenase
MWPDRRICDLFGIEHPIIQAPMTGTCTPALVGAVADAGGLGSLGCALKPLETIREQVGEIRQRTNRGFNLNFFVTPAPETAPEVLERTRKRLWPWYEALGLGSPPAELPALGPGFDTGHLDLVLELKPRVVSFHFGVPERPAIEALKAAGITLVCSATTVAEARALEAAGMDAIIAQGWEAGGHRGSHAPSAPQDGVGTMALVPQIADAVSVPVIAAGGIADGRGIAAAFALGASGVQMGTAFLSCPEAAMTPARREWLWRTKDGDTIPTDAVSGRVARTARSRFTEEMERSREPLPGFVQMYTLSRPILEAAPDDEASFYLCGQAVALSKGLGAGELVEALVAEARAVLSGLQRA